MTAAQFAETTGIAVVMLSGTTLLLCEDREMNRYAWAFAAVWLVAVVVLACVNG